MKNEIYIVTGANGHLGKIIVKNLLSKNCEVRGLVLNGEEHEVLKGVEYFYGDVRDRNSLEPMFLTDQEIYLIHTAAIVDISEVISTKVYDVNVNGTKNIIELCRKYYVKRLLHVSSVHAIPEIEDVGIISEITSFHSDEVIGGYAKTKAEASQLVLDAVNAGLDAVIVHPSGIIGPYDDQNSNHLVQMISDCIEGKTPALVDGGYDFVDVRDVAIGCLLALEKGKEGECYILSNRHYQVWELLRMISSVVKIRKLPVLPISVAECIVPFFGCYAKMTRRRPLFTKYSLHTLKAKYYFSHDKATSELGFRPRDIKETMIDTAEWIISNKEEPSKANNFRVN
ncbi:MAG: NAD-dependent epimerase/dehydratase family protein [Eubacteriales bacterium]